MNKKEAWNQFKKSGSIEDYLNYAKKKRSEENVRKSGGDNR